MGCEAWFSWFADNMATGSSPSYETLSRQVAQDAELCAQLDRLPPGKQQPNLLFAAVRSLDGPTDDWTAFRAFVEERWDEVAELLVSRSTQTNEVARCAMLLPVLASLPQPLALIEVGASAGLCLLPDRYQYCYDETVVGEPSTVRIDVRCEGPVPVPESLPVITSRVGLDLNPLDVTNADDVAWLQACVWPEHHQRRARLDAAIDLSRDAPPEIVNGDLASDLVPLLDRTVDAATTVVFHSAVLVYCSDSQRSDFTDVVTSRPDVVWVSNEAPGAVPGLTVDQPVPSIASSPVTHVVSVGDTAVARSDDHGSWLAWKC